MTTWFLLAGFGGIAIIGAVLWVVMCDEVAQFIAERIDIEAENEFLKMTDDELVELILADPRRSIVLN